MKIRTPIRAPSIVPVWVIVRTALVAALITSLPWAWRVHQERELSERLLLDSIARYLRVDQVAVRYSNGASITVEVKERQ